MFRSGFTRILAFLLGLTFLLAPPRARAEFTLTLTEGAQSLRLSDGGTGVISYMGSFGDFGFEALTATSNSPGSADGGMLQNIDISTTNRSLVGGPAVLILALSSDGFTGPGQAGDKLELDSSLATSHIDPGGQGTLVSSLDSVTTGPLKLAAGSKALLGGNAYNAAYGTRGNSYVLGNVLTVTLGAKATAQFTATTTTTVVTPAPGALALGLTGTALLGVGVYVRRRRGLATQTL